MKPQLLVCAALLFLLNVAAADAQILPRWFGSKTSDKPKSTQPDLKRVTEVNVEIAWLADPVTFPYYLEAHANGTQIEVRGFVPNKAVREHALRIAQVFSSMPVVDAMKEHPSLTVRPSQMSPQQLQTSVMASLKVALPKQYQQLKAECGKDGKVYVVGTVSNLEEKLVVSHSLRRLHGCSSVENLTVLPNDTAQNPQRDKAPIIKASSSSEKPVVALENKTKASWWPFSKASKSTEEPSVEVKKTKEPQGPILIPNVEEPKKDVVKAGNTPTISANELRKRIQKAFPKVKSVEVRFTSATDVQITLEIANESELKATAERLFDLPELANLRPELQFKISAP